MKRDLFFAFRLSAIALSLLCLLPACSTSGDVRRVCADFPLYEFEYKGSYDRGSLELPVPAAAASVGGAAREPAFACTCIAARRPDGGRLMGRNFDWYPNPALVLVTRPEDAYASISMVDISYLGYGAGKDPRRDPSGLERAWRLPFDGMNERGLAVGMMAVPNAYGGSGESRPMVGSLGIIRILLDEAADVAEALALLEKYDVLFDEVPVHYLIADAAGDAVVVEYLDGRPRAVRSAESWAVSTNFVLSGVEEARRRLTCRRYGIVSEALGGSGGVLEDGDAAFALLEDVSQDNTRWSTLYDLAGRKLSLAVGRDFRRTYEWRL